MLASLLIIFASVVLLGYWFRYSCLLIIRADHEDGLASEVAATNQLSFPDVRWQLPAAEPPALEALYRSLEQDRQVLVYLLNHSLGPQLPFAERQMAVADYWLMWAWYKLSKNFSCPQARGALDEMSSVLSYLARAMALRALARS